MTEHARLAETPVARHFGAGRTAVNRLERDPGQLPAWLNMRETTDFLGCHERTVRARVATGELPAYRLGREFRFRREDVEALLKPVPSAGDVD